MKKRTYHFATILLISIMILGSQAAHCHSKKNDDYSIIANYF